MFRKLIDEIWNQFKNAQASERKQGTTNVKECCQHQFIQGRKIIKMEMKKKK